MLRLRRALTALVALAATASLVVPATAAHATTSDGAQAVVSPAAAKTWVGKTMSTMTCQFDSTLMSTGGGAVDVLRMCHNPDSGKWTAKLATQLKTAGQAKDARTLSGPVGYAMPKIATGSDGSGALLVPTDTGVELWRRPAGSSSWTKQQTIAGRASDVGVGISKSGTVTVATAIGRTLALRTAAPGKALSSPQKLVTVSPTNSSGYEWARVALSVDPSGGAVVAFAYMYGDKSWKTRVASAVVATRTAGKSTFGAPTSFSSAEPATLQVQQAGAKSVVVWTNSKGAHARVRPTATSAWTAAKQVGSVEGTVALAGSPNGRVDVAVTTYAGALHTRSLGAGTASSFSAVRFKATKVDPFEVRLVHRAAGEPVLLYALTTSSPFRGKQRQVVGDTTGTTWRTFSLLSSESVDLPGAGAAGDGAGTAAVHVRPATKGSYLAVWK